MSHIKVTTEIDAPVETVFAYVDDYRNTTKYMRDLTRWAPVGSKSHGKGAVFEVAMKAGPKLLESVIEMDAWTENRSIGWASTDGFDQKGKWTFKAKGHGTEAVFEMDYELGGGIAGRLIGRTIEPLVRMSVEKSVELMRQQAEKLAAKTATKGTVGVTGKATAKPVAKKTPARR